ncbi:MAG TPA: hypothetical protein VFY10_13685 [Dehalococcoidia bacterium]|nr:hypothetical protein [Dehalococcoidia bacterium]
MLRFGLKAVSLTGFVILLAGVFMTWSDNAPFSKKGIDESDGVLMLVIAIAGIAMTVFGRRPRAVLINASAAGLALVIALLNLIDVSSSVANVGSGLYLAIAGAAIATAAASTIMFASLKKPEAAPTETPAH